MLAELVTMLVVSPSLEAASQGIAEPFSGGGGAGAAIANASLGGTARCQGW
jgi:hypothetical protein